MTSPFPGDFLEHLRAFLAVSAFVAKKTPSPFSRAAQALAVDVSVLRRRIQTLDSYFGEALFSGRGSDLAPTEAGRRIAARATDVLALVDALQTRAPKDDATLRIGCTGTFSSEVLPRVLRALKRRFFSLHLEVKRAGSRSGRALLEEGAIDFLVLRAHKKPEHVASIRVSNERTWLAVPRKHALATSARVTLAAIAREPLIGYAAPSFTMDRVLRVLAPHGVSPWIEMSGKSGAIAYVAQELGVAFVSLLASQTPSHAGVVFREVTSLFDPVAFFLAWKPRTLAPWERAFVDLVAAERA